MTEIKPVVTEKLDVHCPDETLFVAIFGKFGLLYVWRKGQTHMDFLIQVFSTEVKVLVEAFAEEMKSVRSD